MQKRAIRKQIVLVDVFLLVFFLGAFVPRYEHTSASVTSQVLDAYVRIEKPQLPKVVQIGIEPAPSLTAKSVLVFDTTTNSILLSKDYDKKLPIASLTKLMTGVVAISSPDFSRPITITSADQLNVAPSLGLRAGDIVFPSDLLKAMIIGSANDAALTLANHFPNNTDFVSKMNQEAVLLGMTGTHFSTPIGFDYPDNYSTAADLNKLVDYALKNLPYGEIWGTENYSFFSLNGRQFFIRNSNKLVGVDSEIKSIKTGKTKAAMENMIVMAQDKDGHRIISILLGSQDRAGETLKVVDYIFQNYAWE